MKERMMRAPWFPYRFLIAAAVLAALFCLMPIHADAPETGMQMMAQGEQLLPAAESPGMQGVPAGADLSQRTQENAYLHRTLRYRPCGHSVQRREQLPSALKGLSRAALEAQIGDVIAGAQVTGFSAQEVDILMETDIPCPLHWVIAVGENGQVQVLQNRTGEALTVVRETDILSAQLSDETRDQLLDGIIFDDVQQAEGYLESLSS